MRVALTASVLIGCFAASDPTLAPLLVALLGIGALVYHKPHIAAFLYAGLTPLVVGLNRGSILPGARLNEALLGFLCLTVSVRLLVDYLRGRRNAWPSPVRLDYAVLALAVLSSAMPLAWAVVRSRVVSGDDLVFALTLTKFALVYALFRVTVHGRNQVERVVTLTLYACGAVAIIGLLQAAGLSFARPLLALYAERADLEAGDLDISRASSTIGSPIAFADVMIMCAALCLALAFSLESRSKLSYLVAAGLFSISALASGQFSSAIGLIIMVAVLGFVTRRLGQLTMALAAILVATFPLLAPVLDERLGALDPSTGLPAQWTGDAGRWTNLTIYVWPRILEGSNWLFGVRTSARIPSPYPWREWIWIESGYSWALWAGGVPLLAACIAFFVIAARRSLALTRYGFGFVQAIGISTLVAVVVIGSLMVIDPHLTMRGSADLLFMLVALTAGLSKGAGGRPPGVAPRAVATPSIAAAPPDVRLLL